MGKFLANEKPKQAQFKASSSYFSGAAKAEGMYKNHPYSFCLPREVSQENIFSEIRQPIMDYFARNSNKVARWAKWKTEQPPMQFAGLWCQFPISIR